MRNNVKNCPHKNKVQAGTETIIETFCTDCNEVIKIQMVKIKK
jgi:hypothetical protein